MKKFVELLSSVVIFITVPLFVFLLVTSHFSVFWGIRSFDVLTGSMVPEIPIGGIVFTRPLPDYQKGDIITFKRGNITVTHRINDIKNDLFITKGDANNSPDPQSVSKSEIIGKDIFIFPYLGSFSNFLKTPTGFTLLVILPVLLYIIFELNSIKNEYKKQIRKELLKELENKSNS